MDKIIRNEVEAQQLLDIASKTGQILMKNGAEIYRIEDTIERICKSWIGFQSVDVFAMTTSLFITARYEDKPLTVIIRERRPSLSLEHVNLANQFSRKFCNTMVSFADAFEELSKIEKYKSYNIHLKTFGAGITSAFFSIMFGGNIRDFISSFIIGTVVSYIILVPKGISLQLFFDDIFSGFLSSLFAAIFVELGIGSSLDMIIIGTIMPYVPGAAITTSFRDIMAGDYVSGLMMMIKAIFTALAIAFGVGIVLAVYLGG